MSGFRRRSLPPVFPRGEGTATRRLGSTIFPTPSSLQLLDVGDHATNNETAWLVIAGFLDQEVLVPAVTLSVIKSN